MELRYTLKHVRRNSITVRSPHFTRCSLGFSADRQHLMSRTSARLSQSSSCSTYLPPGNTSPKIEISQKTPIHRTDYLPLVGCTSNPGVAVFTYLCFAHSLIFSHFMHSCSWSTGDGKSECGVHLITRIVMSALHVTEWYKLCKQCPGPKVSLQ